MTLNSAHIAHPHPANHCSINRRMLALAQGNSFDWLLRTFLRTDASCTTCVPALTVQVNDLSDANCSLQSLIAIQVVRSCGPRLLMLSSVCFTTMPAHVFTRAKIKLTNYLVMQGHYCCHASRRPRSRWKLLVRLGGLEASSSLRSRHQHVEIALRYG